MKAVVYNGPRDVGVKDVATRGSSARPTCWSGSPRRTSAARTCTCTRAGPTSSRAARSGTRTSGRSSRSATDVEQACRSATGSCLPFNIACGYCKNCERGLTNYCLDRPADGEHGGRRVRLRRHGAVPGRAGRVPARAVGRLQLPAPARGRRGEADRLRHARRHLPDRLPRDGDGRASSPARPW